MTTTLQGTDAELKGALTEELAWPAGLNSANIGVAAGDGPVTLSGEVESHPEKVRAEHAIWPTMRAWAPSTGGPFAVGTPGGRGRRLDHIRRHQRRERPTHRELATLPAS